MERRGLQEARQEEPPLTKQEQILEQARQSRIEAGRKSLLEFGKIYLSHHCTLEASPLHEFLAERFQQMVESPHPERTATAAPRGNAKTTWTSVIGSLWCLCYERKSFVVLISDTTTQAEGNLEAIREELEGNPLLLADFGDLVGDPLKDGRTWTKQRIVTTKGAQISCYGSGKSLRGIKRGAARPDLLIADDLENSEHVLTPGQRKKLEAWWSKDATKLAGPGGMDVFVVGTILHYDSLLSSLLSNPGYLGRKFKAISSWPTRSDLWETWEAIFTDLSREEPDRKREARSFYESNRAEMEEGSSILWPSGDPLYSLMATYVTDGPASFDSEKQNDPVNPDDCLFREEWFSWYAREQERGEPGDLLLPEIVSTVGAIDPSLGRSSSTGDYSAILILGRGADGRDYVLEADLARRSPDQIIEDAIELHRLYQCQEIAVETVAFQAFFADELARRSREQGLHLPIIPIHPTKDKVLRVSSLQPAIRAGNIVFHRSHRLLYEQLRLFPLADHDDGPDSLQMAYERGQHKAAPAIAPKGGTYRGSSSTPSAEGNTRRPSLPRRGGVFRQRTPFRR